MTRPRVTTLLELGERLKELSARRGQPLKLQLTYEAGAYRALIGGGGGGLAASTVATAKHPTDIEALINTVLDFAGFPE